MSVSQEDSNQFLNLCLGSHRADNGELLGIDDDDDFWSAQEDEDEFGECDGDAGAASFFALADSDSEEDEDDAELEDAYNFDPEICAQLLKHNRFTMEELTEKFQESMAQALERRLNVQTCLSSNTESGADGPYESVEDRPDCQGDVDGRMTPPKAHPGCMTPPVETMATHAGPDEQAVAEKLEHAQQRAPFGRARRSSVIKQDAIQEAVSKAVSRHRRSLLCKVSEKNEEGELASPEGKSHVALKSAQKRHRLSILKAAETLDAASLDEDEAAVGKKLQMVHKAMEEARRRHRQSIAEAVQNVTGKPAEQSSKSVSGMSAEATPFHPEQCIRDRIQTAIASAHRRQQQPEQCIRDRFQTAIASARRRQQHEFHPPFDQSVQSQSSGLGCWQSKLNYSNLQSQIHGEAMWNGGSSPQLPCLEEQQSAVNHEQSAYDQQTQMQSSCGSWQPSAMYTQSGYGEHASMEDGTWQGGTLSYPDRCPNNVSYDDTSCSSYQQCTGFQQLSSNISYGTEGEQCQQNTYGQQPWLTEGSGFGQAWPAALGSA